MTVKEFYRWARDHKVEDDEITIEFDDVNGFGGLIFLEKKNLKLSDIGEFSIYFPLKVESLEKFNKQQ